MKVELESDYRNVYTLNEYDQALNLIEIMEADESPVEYYARLAVNEAMKGFSGEKCTTDILYAKASTIRNYSMAYGCHSTDKDTGSMDVWVEFAVEGYLEHTPMILKGAAYLSDIIQTGAKDYSNNIWTQLFTA